MRSIRHIFSRYFMSQEEQVQQPDNTETTATPHETEVMPSMEEMLKEAERKAQEHYDAWG